MHIGLNFPASFELMKYLKSFLPKGILLDTSILSISILKYGQFITH